MAIDTREELIIALQRACEIEHALLVQYLYTAISMKKALNEGLTVKQQKLVRGWQAQILLTARDEMGHLAIVCNLLAAIGAPAKFDRPAMPRKVDYYPFPFDLIPFSDEALYRFLVFELPRGFPLPPPPNSDLSGTVEALDTFKGIAPEPLKFTYIGELYAQIAEGFSHIDEALLFIGPEEAQTGNNWSDRGLDIHPVKNRADSLAAIEDIIVDGEGGGGDANNPDSHYNRFLRIREAYFSEGRFEAARPLARNPATREDGRSSGEINLITDTSALHIAEIFNSAYGLMLMLLQAYFSMAPKKGEPDLLRRRALQFASQRLMSVALRPLAEELTFLPLEKGTSERAGPPFEIYSDIVYLPYEPACWIILLERFDLLASECASLGTPFPRIGELGETLAIMAGDLRATLLGKAI